MIERYKYLLTKISDKLPNNYEKQFLNNNINEIASDFHSFSKYINSVMDIAITKSDIKTKLKQIRKLKINKKKLSVEESANVLNSLYFYKSSGGGQAESTSIDPTQASVNENSKPKIPEDWEPEKPEHQKKETEILDNIHKSVEKNTTFCIANFGLVATKILTNFPKYGILMLSTFFSNLATI